MPKLKVFREKNLEHFWSKFAPPEFRFIEYHRMSLMVMTISCKTWLLFVVAAFKIKNLLCICWVLISLYVSIQEFFNKIPFKYDIALSPVIKFK
jgi:hypothetical protein